MSWECKLIYNSGKIVYASTIVSECNNNNNNNNNNNLSKQQHNNKTTTSHKRVQNKKISFSNFIKNTMTTTTKDNSNQKDNSKQDSIDYSNFNNINPEHLSIIYNGIVVVSINLMEEHYKRKITHESNNNDNK